MHSTVTNRGGSNDVSEDRMDLDSRYQRKMVRDDLLEENDVERILSRPSLSRRKLEIYEAPEFVRRLSNYQEAYVGETVTFTGQYRAFPKPTVKWYKDEEEINETKRHDIDLSSESEGIVRLIIQELIRQDEGAYKLKVENQEGVASTTGYLSVSVKSSGGPPSPTRKPAQERVSSIPFLRPIVEQKSMEETEEQEYQRLPPSPLQEFMDKIRHGAKSMHGPIFYADIADVYPDEDSVEDFDSETTGDEEDVFDEDIDDPTVSSSPADDLHCEVSFTSIPNNGSIRTDSQDVGMYPSPSADPKQVITTSQIAGEDSDQGSLVQVVQVQCDREGAESSRRQRRLKLTLQRSEALELPDSDAAPGAKFPHDDTGDGQTARDSVRHWTSSGQDVQVQKLNRANVSESPGTKVCRKTALSLDMVANLIDSRWAQYFTGFIMGSVAVALAADISPAYLVAAVVLLSLISFAVLERHLPNKENT